MTAPTLTAAPASPPLARLDDLLATVAARAADIDRGGGDLRVMLGELGAARLLSLGTPGGEGTVADQAEVLRRLAGACMSTAFSTWAQRMTIDYLARWGDAALREELLPDLVAGRRPGATALATAFQDALGLRELALTATVDGDEVVLDGTIPWASNLFPNGAVVVLPARTAAGDRLVVAVTTDRICDEAPAYPPLLALGATASTSVHLHRVRVPATWVLTDRYRPFLAAIRPTFLLLQTAFCLGLTDTALAGAAGRFDGPAVVLAPDHDRLVDRRDLTARTHRDLLDRLHQGSLDASVPADAAALVQLRLDAGTLAVEATRHEATVRGGAGYLASSPVARRLREAAFLPIQSPTEAQLRWELSRSE